WKKDAALNHRVLEAIDETLPDLVGEEFTEMRRLFREGTSAMKALQAMHVIDEPTHRLNLERVATAAGARFGAHGEAGTSILEKYVKPSHAPEAAKLLRR